jgi:hypothetical protein
MLLHDKHKRAGRSTLLSATPSHSQPPLLRLTTPEQTRSPNHRAALHYLIQPFTASLNAPVSRPSNTTLLKTIHDHWPAHLSAKTLSLPRPTLCSSSLSLQHECLGRAAKVSFQVRGLGRRDAVLLASASLMQLVLWLRVTHRTSLPQPPFSPSSGAC